MSKVPRLLPLVAIAIGGVVAVKAVGFAPGLFDGAKAWAEEAVPEKAAAQPRAAVCALTPEQLAQQAGLSPAELRVLQALKARREQLDARDADLVDMLPLMTAAEQKLDEKTAALNAIKTEVQGLLGQVDERQKAENDRLVAVYSAMRPREAARVFATLDDSVRLPVAAAMRPRSLAAIMAQMDPAAAQVLTEKLARRFEAQQLAARAAVASAVQNPAPAPAATTAAAPTNAAATPTTRAPAAQPAAAPAASRTTPQPAVRRPATTTPRPQSQRPATTNRPTTPRPQTTRTPAAAEPQGERPYQAAGGAAPSANAAQPRQSVQ